MKSKILITTTISSFFLLPSAFGQGALTPPGVPAPTMKSLAQIEPRTPISSAPIVIAASGSYYLTTNLSVTTGNAITVFISNVTLDLNGFTIASTAASATGYAIQLGAVTNVAIYNGHISGGVTNSAAGVFGGGGFADGIYYSGNPSYNVRVKDVSVAGVLSSGIYLGSGNSSVVESCTVNIAGGYGIYADSVSDSTAMNCGNYGIHAGMAHNCTGYAIGNADGLYATTADNCCGICSGFGTGLYGDAVATGCYGSSSYGVGLFANTAYNCFGSGFNGVIANNIANSCYGSGSGGGDGVNAVIANNCVGQSSGSGHGIYAGGVATDCVSYSSSGIGLSAVIASACHATTSTGTAFSVTHNVNSF